MYQFIFYIFRTQCWWYILYFTQIKSCIENVFSVHHPQKKRRDNYFQMKILRKGIRWGKEQIVAIPSQRLSHKLLEIHYIIEIIRQMFVFRRKNIWNDMTSYSLWYSLHILKARVLILYDAKIFMIYYSIVGVKSSLNARENNI